MGKNEVVGFGFSFMAHKNDLGDTESERIACLGKALVALEEKVSDRPNSKEEFASIIGNGEATILYPGTHLVRRPVQIFEVGSEQFFFYDIYNHNYKTIKSLGPVDIFFAGVIMRDIRGESFELIEDVLSKYLPHVRSAISRLPNLVIQDDTLRLWTDTDL